MSVIVISGEEDFINNVSKNEQIPDLILAYFTAKWCGPCKMVSPIVQRIGEEKDSVVVLKVDVDECSDISDSCEIDCMPTFLFYKESNIEPIERFSGADIDLLVQKINNHLTEQ